MVEVRNIGAVCENRLQIHAFSIIPCPIFNSIFYNLLKSPNQEPSQYFVTFNLIWRLKKTTSLELPPRQQEKTRNSIYQGNQDKRMRERKGENAREKEKGRMRKKTIENINE